MVEFKYYDEDAGKEFVWYKSDNLVYSEALEQEDGTVNLKVVFKQGATYLYYKVDMEDYTHVKVADSNGRTFNVLISKKIDGEPKYKYKRIADTDEQIIVNLKKQFEERMFAEAEQAQNAADQKSSVVNEAKTEAKNDIQQKNTASTTPAQNHKLDIRYDDVMSKMVVNVDGEDIATYPCPNQNSYARLALFLAPIVSYLGYPLKINVGD